MIRLTRRAPILSFSSPSRRRSLVFSLWRRSSPPSTPFYFSALQRPPGLPNRLQLAKLWEHNINLSLVFGLMMIDCQHRYCFDVSFGQHRVQTCIVQACLLACGVRVCSTWMMVDAECEDHAGSCWWVGSGEGRAMSLDRETLGDKPRWLIVGTHRWLSLKTTLRLRRMVSLSWSSKLDSEVPRGNQRLDWMTADEENLSEFSFI